MHPPSRSTVNLLKGGITMSNKDEYRVEAIEEMLYQVNSLMEDYATKRDEYNYYNRHELAIEYHEKVTVCSQFIEILKSSIEIIRSEE